MSAVLIVVAFVSGCIESSRKTATAVVGDSTDVVSVADTTAYGFIGEATAMHTLQLIGDGGDTTEYFISDEGSVVSEVKGGMLVGDRIAVIGTVVGGEMVAQKVLNLTSLLGRWMSIDKTFEIKEGGEVSSAPKPETGAWTSWRVSNGRLVLDRDTFEVLELGHDSLYLENSEGIFTYKRQQ